MERSTRQRQSIRSAIADAARPLLPSEILSAARRDVPAMGLATVYRNLKQLAQAGEIQAVDLPGEPPRFELAGRHHHHHFRCNSCSRVFDVHGCPGDMRQLVPRGFQVDSHELTLYGRCADCRPVAGMPPATAPADGAQRRSAPTRPAAAAPKPRAKAPATTSATIDARGGAAPPARGSKRGKRATSPGSKRMSLNR